METKDVSQKTATEKTVSRETIAHDFGKRMSGKLDPKMIQSVQNNILTTKRYSRLIIKPLD